MAPILKFLFAIASLAILSNAAALPAADAIADADPEAHYGKGRWQDGRWKPSRWSRSTPTLPLDQVQPGLPAPTKDPKYILLGLGFQNYTCGPANTYIASVPNAGAIADLYDITKQVTKHTDDLYTKNTLKAFEKCLKLTKCSPSPSNGYCDKCHSISAAAFDRNHAGEHYFDQSNGAQVPNFDVSKFGDFISAKRGAGVKAPADAYKGQSGTGAVDWLYLVDNGNGRTKGLTSVYRVQTAGGVAPASCQAGKNSVQVAYATEYWFYD